MEIKLTQLLVRKLDGYNEVVETPLESIVSNENKFKKFSDLFNSYVRYYAGDKNNGIFELAQVLKVPINSIGTLVAEDGYVENDAMFNLDFFLQSRVSVPQLIEFMSHQHGEAGVKNIRENY
jgi:hypothetical protein